MTLIDRLDAMLADSTLSHAQVVDLWVVRDAAAEMQSQLTIARRERDEAREADPSDLLALGIGYVVQIETMPAYGPEWRRAKLCRSEPGLLLVKAVGEGIGVAAALNEIRKKVGVSSDG